MTQKHTRLKTMLLGALSLSLCSSVGAIGFNAKDANISSKPKRNFPTNGGASTSSALQALINANSPRGAVITFAPNRTYNLDNIILKSNIHLRIPPSSILKPTPSSRKRVMFQIGENNRIARNVTIQSTTRRFTVDFRDRDIGSPTRFVISGNANNVQIRDVLVKDNQTKFNAVVPVEPELNLFTKRFSLKNIRQTNSNGGYGIMQVARVTDAYIRNIAGIGGIPLRLETHTAKGNKGVTDLRASNITGTRGRAALSAQPHSSDSIRVNIRNVTANSCAYGTLTPNGFGRRVGKYTDTTISDVKVYYGYRAQEDLFRRARYMVDSEWNKFANSNFVKNRTRKQLDDLGEGLPGISITGIFDTKNPISDITYSDVKIRRFPAGVPKRMNEDNSNNYNTVMRPRFNALNQ